MAGMITTSQLCLNMGAMYTPQPPQLSPFHGQDGDHPMNPLFLFKRIFRQIQPYLSESSGLPRGHTSLKLRCGHQFMPADAVKADQGSEGISRIGDAVSF